MTLRSYTQLKRTPLKRQSDKARDALPARAACIRAVVKRSGNLCEAKIAEAGCTGWRDDVHEKLPRSAVGSTTDPDNCLAVCRNCHNYIHQNPDYSYRVGFLISRYEGK